MQRQQTNCSSRVPFGTNRDPIPSTFPDSNPTQYSAINELFKGFLRSAYSEEEIRVSALPAGVDPGQAEDCLPFDAAIRTIHDDMDLSDESDSDDEGSDSSEDDSDDEPPTTGAKRKRNEPTEPPMKKKKAAPKKAVRKKKISTKAMKGVDTRTKVVEVEKTGASTPSDTTNAPLVLPFDVADPAIFKPSVHFSFEELLAPLNGENVPDYMNPELWGMEDWIYDATAIPSLDVKGSVDPATTMGPSPKDFSVKMSSDPAVSTFPAVSVSASSGVVGSLIKPGMTGQAGGVFGSLAKVAPSGTSTDELDIDLDTAAEWFRVIWVYLENEELGGDLRLVMNEWYRLEKAYNFTNARAGYSAQGRPNILSGWIKCSRVRVANPSIVNLKKFKAEFWSWWLAQQPEWRDASMQMTPDGRSWQSARFPGVNGMCSFVALLRWWGDAAKGLDEEVMEWKKAVHDVMWVIKELRSEVLG